MEGMHEAGDGVNDFMMPGFRFHPTDEELVGFYLKRKLQLKSLPIELIKQVDIYKYDPWDLPKLASTREKEWYFYCPRDRKYKNSTRPNRVTGSGFWKATGTDRPIYSSDGACIGLKKSLVFYRGKAAKGAKTDWMMHEFRLSSTTMDRALVPPSTRKVLDKNLPPTDSWAICRIFKKTNSMANRALTHPAWSPSFPESSSQDCYIYNTQFNAENTSSTTGHDFQQALNIPSFSSEYFPEDVGFSPPQQASGTTSNRTTADPTSMLFNPPSFIQFKGQQQQFNGHSDISSNTLQASTGQWGDNIRSVGFPFSLPDSWNSPHEISSATYSTNMCYTYGHS